MGDGITAGSALGLCGQFGEAEHGAGGLVNLLVVAATSSPNLFKGDLK